MNSGSFALTSASGVGGLLGDFKTAKNKLHDQAGTRIRATHAFAIGDLCDYIGSYADAQGRPVFSPSLDDNRLPVRSVGDQDAEGYSGFVLVGLALFADDSIPTTTTANLTQIIVTRASEILQLSGPPIQYVMPQGVGGSLEAIIGVRQYCATVARFPSGVATIGGAAYAASTFA